MYSAAFALSPVRAVAAPAQLRNHQQRHQNRKAAVVVCKGGDTQQGQQRQRRAVLQGGALAAFALFTAATASPARAAGGYGGGNDCDPICNILKDGGVKSQAKEAETRAAGPEMGSMLEQMIKQRKADDAAAAKARAAAAQ